MFGMKSRRLAIATFAVLVAAVFFIVWQFSEWRLEHSQDTHIIGAARRYGIDPALVKAVVWRESHFHPKARGKAGEVGLMQLTDAAAQEWAETSGVYPISEMHLLDPATNTLAGTWYLGKLIRRYQRADDPLPYALADYNAGRANVLKWADGEALTNSAAFINRITFPGTRAYVLAVLEKQKHYRREFAPVAQRSAAATK